MSVELIVDNTQASLDMVMPVARIKGELITDLPADLFIPPDALSVILDEFEGPLDLLLYLIRKHSLDISIFRWPISPDNTWCTWRRCARINSNSQPSTC